jgi:hypothetical protein
MQVATRNTYLRTSTIMTFTIAIQTISNRSHLLDELNTLRIILNKLDEHSNIGLGKWASSRTIKFK